MISLFYLYLTFLQELLSLRNNNWLRELFNIVFSILYQSSLDQEVYDYIDPNAEEGAVPEQGDVQIGTLLSFIKVV